MNHHHFSVYVTSASG